MPGINIFGKGAVIGTEFTLVQRDTIKAANA